MSEIHNCVEEHLLIVDAEVEKLVRSETRNVIVQDITILCTNLSCLKSNWREVVTRVYSSADCLSYIYIGWIYFIYIVGLGVEWTQFYQVGEIEWETNSGEQLWDAEREKILKTSEFLTNLSV